jgi:hypothetical protein
MKLVITIISLVISVGFFIAGFITLVSDAPVHEWAAYFALAMALGDAAVEEY